MVYCQECGTKNEEKAIYCQECGSNINLKALNILSKPKGKKICPTCETIYKSGQNFCEECGSNLSLTHNAKSFERNNGWKICPLCKTKSESKFNFCTECGANLNLPEKEALAIKNGNKRRNTHIGYWVAPTWDTIDNKEAIQKVSTSQNLFYTDIEVIEESPGAKTVIKKDKGSRFLSTLGGGLLFGPVGAIAGYAAARDPEVKIINQDPKKKILNRRIFFSVSVHEKGIKLIKEKENNTWNTKINQSVEDPYKMSIIKIPWNKIAGVNHNAKSISIELTTQEVLILKGDLKDLKGLYLIINDSMTDDGWD